MKVKSESEVAQSCPTLHDLMGCRFVAPLFSGIYPLVDELGPGACMGFLVGATGACPLVGRAGFYCPSVQGHVKWYV